MLDIAKGGFQAEGNKFEQMAVFSSLLEILPPTVRLADRFSWTGGRCIRLKAEGAESHIKRYGADYFPITVEAHLDLMRKCGFQAVELIWMSYMQAGLMGIKL